jgi:hypothetical protein
MIFTNCTACNSVLVCYYEAGKKPVGVYERIECEDCGAANFVQRVSIEGRTYSEEEFLALNPIKFSRKEENP